MYVQKMAIQNDNNKKQILILNYFIINAIRLSSRGGISSKISNYIYTYKFVLSLLEIFINNILKFLLTFTTNNKTNVDMYY